MHIAEFQEMMKRLYGERDKARGVDGTYNWLLEEVAELGQELKGSDRVATEKEFADVIAWLASLANIMGIDLEKAALAKYPDKCPKCQARPANAYSSLGVSGPDPSAATRSGGRHGAPRCPHFLEAEDDTLPRCR